MHNQGHGAIGAVSLQNGHNMIPTQRMRVHFGSAVIGSLGVMRAKITRGRTITECGETLGSLITLISKLTLFGSIAGQILRSW